MLILLCIRIAIRITPLQRDITLAQRLRRWMQDNLVPHRLGNPYRRVELNTPRPELDAYPVDLTAELSRYTRQRLAGLMRYQPYRVTISQPHLRLLYFLLDL